MCVVATLQFDTAIDFFVATLQLDTAMKFVVVTLHLGNMSPSFIRRKILCKNSEPNSQKTHYDCVLNTSRLMLRSKTTAVFF